MSATTIVGLLLGSVLLLGALFAHLKRQTFGLGGVVLVVFGCFLIGLSAFTSFEFAVGPVTGKYIQEAREDLSVKTADLNGSIEQLKVKLAELTQDVAAIKRLTPGAAPTQEQASKRERVWNDSSHRIQSTQSWYFISQGSERQQVRYQGRCYLLVLDRPQLQQS